LQLGLVVSDLAAFSLFEMNIAYIILGWIQIKHFGKVFPQKSSQSGLDFTPKHKEHNKEHDRQHNTQQKEER
jgi:hypothetical protein